jgi:hypothetical protein
MKNPYLKTQIMCAGPLCQHMKGETNHWFIVVPRVAMTKAVVTFCGIEPMYAVLPYDEAALAMDRALPVCGEACLGKLQSELLNRKQGG